MSQWSEETWSSTESDGVSAVCFGMAVRCGYIKQVASLHCYRFNFLMLYAHLISEKFNTPQLQTMLEERPELIDFPSTNGLTPLATAIRKGCSSTITLQLNA